MAKSNDKNTAAGAGAGYVEKSVQDRHDSMRDIPTDLGKTAERGFKPIGGMAADPHGYRPSPEQVEPPARVGKRK